MLLGLFLLLDATGILMRNWCCFLIISDEYTRITTPRQDVLFKKGYLSRMNNNKTATTTTNINSTDTTSDLDSSVSTLSPATTPSTEYSAGTKFSSDMADAMDYPMYYPGCYYDENGVMVFRKLFELIFEIS